MASGGKRPGAGRKPGRPNKATAAQRKAVIESGQSPLDYMLSVMRDEEAEKSRRDDMAKAAAPYVHPKLSAMQVSGDPDNPVVFAKVERVIVDPSKPADAKD